MKVLKTTIILLIFVISYHVSYVHASSKNQVIFLSKCFWITEANFKGMIGVLDVSPVYILFAEQEQSLIISDSNRRIGIQIVFNPNLISYLQLLNKFLRTVDPTDVNEKTIIYTFSENQARITRSFINKIKSLSSFFLGDITIEVHDQPVFYKTEDSYRDYAQHNPFLCSFEKSRSGMDCFIHNFWNSIPESFFLEENELELLYTKNTVMEEKFARYVKPPLNVLVKNLTDIQFRVTQLKSTEKPFENEYYQNKCRGLYVDILSGEPLFSSRDQIDSTSGFPTFLQPVAPHFILEKDDFSFYTHKIEVRSRYADSHLGYVVREGLLPDSLRYIINSAALRFIPHDQMNHEGYGDYKSHV